MTHARRLVDAHGRAVRALRISVLDRCNLRCRYCLPEERVSHIAPRQRLDVDDFVFVASVAGALGVRRLRVTGGEPLLWRPLPDLIAGLSALETCDDLSLTTNGLLLDRLAGALARAGLRRVNVSIDALDAQRYAELARGGDVDRAWKGVEAAVAAGLGPIKINVVVLGGINDAEIPEWVELTRTADLTVRFLELMPIGEGAALWAAGRWVDLTHVQEALQRTAGLERADDAHRGSGPARYWRLPGARGRLGFITPLSNPYCDTCSRFRLSSDGRIRPCLADDRELDLHDAIVARDAHRLTEGLRLAAATKAAGHRWRAGVVTQTTMARMGG